MFSSVSWLEFIGGFAVVSLGWIAYVYRDDILRRGKPPEPGTPLPPPGPKRIWQVNEAPDPATQPVSAAAAGSRNYQPPPYQTHDPYQEDEVDEEDDMEDGPNDGEFEALEEIAVSIRQTITDNREIGSNIGLLDKIKPIIASYPDLGHPSLRAAIQNMIARAAFQECGLSLTTAELDTLWQQEG